MSSVTAVVYFVYFRDDKQKNHIKIHSIYSIFILYRYVPTLWGYSGHLQTVFHSIVGRVKCPWPTGERIYLALDDNSTLTYDLYQPLNKPNGNVYSLTAILNIKTR